MTPDRGKLYIGGLKNKEGELLEKNGELNLEKSHKRILDVYGFKNSKDLSHKRIPIVNRRIKVLLDISRRSPSK